MALTRSSLEYLVTCSNEGLESFELSRLNQASMLRKEVRQIFEQLVQMEVDARLARCILECKRAEISLGATGACQLDPPPQRQIASADSAQPRPHLSLSLALHDGSEAPLAESVGAAAPAKSMPRGAERSSRIAAHDCLKLDSTRSLPTSAGSPEAARSLSLGCEGKSALEDLEDFVCATLPKALPAAEPSPGSSAHSARRPQKGSDGPGRIAMLRARRAASARKPLCHALARLHRAS